MRGLSHIIELGFIFGRELRKTLRRVRSYVVVEGADSQTANFGSADADDGNGAALDPVSGAHAVQTYGDARDVIPSAAANAAEGNAVNALVGGYADAAQRQPS